MFTSALLLPIALFWIEAATGTILDVLQDLRSSRLKRDDFSNWGPSPYQGFYPIAKTGSFPDLQKPPHPMPFGIVPANPSGHICKSCSKSSAVANPGSINTMPLDTQLGGVGHRCKTCSSRLHGPPDTPHASNTVKRSNNRCRTCSRRASGNPSFPRQAPIGTEDSFNNKNPFQKPTWDMDIRKMEGGIPIDGQKARDDVKVLQNTINKRMSSNSYTNRGWNFNKKGYEVYEYVDDDLRRNPWYGRLYVTPRPKVSQT